jgi:hypothetical protein
MAHVGFSDKLFVKIKQKQWPQSGATSLLGRLSGKDRFPPTAEIHMRGPFLGTGSVMRAMLGDRFG